MSKGDEDAEKGPQGDVKGRWKIAKIATGVQKYDKEVIEENREELKSNVKSFTHSSLAVLTLDVSVVWRYL